jgi:hypothetical protein
VRRYLLKFFKGLKLKLQFVRSYISSDLEELFVSQMLTMDNVFSAQLSVVGLCENE